MAYILIFWAFYHDVKIPATAEFHTVEACTSALMAVQQEGMNGICVPNEINGGK